jgi:hypothetical protein
VGCSIPVVLILILFGGALFFGYRMASQITDDSPENRSARARDVLGCEAIPEGYHPAITLSVPFLFEMTMLSDRPFEPTSKDKSPPFEEKGLIYVKSIRGNNEQKLRDFIDGKADPAELLGQGNIRIGKLEPIARGEVEGAGGILHWASNRGTMQAHGKNIDGLVSLVYVECKGDSRFRLAVWFGPDPNKDVEIAKADYAGTAASEGQIQAFMSQFSLCDR